MYMGGALVEQRIASSEKVDGCAGYEVEPPMIMGGGRCEIEGVPGVVRRRAL